MNTFVKGEATALAALADSELLEVLQSSLYPGANPNSIRLVLGYCKAAGLDPMQKPVHIVSMWSASAGQMRDMVMPGIGLYRTIAARCGCAGVDEPQFGPELTETLGEQEITYPLWCRVTVRRRLATGEVVQFTAKELWKENYALSSASPPAPNAMWRRRPYGQLAKCAEAQALRKAFPEIGAQPAAEEMEGKFLDDTTPEITNLSRKPAVAMPQRRSDAPAPEPSSDTPSAQAGTAGDTVLATPGEVSYLLAKITSRNMTVEAARAAAGLAPGDTLEGLTRGGFAALRAALA